MTLSVIQPLRYRTHCTSRTYSKNSSLTFHLIHDSKKGKGKAIVNENKLISLPQFNRNRICCTWPKKKPNIKSSQKKDEYAL